jgi:hypothetical protein
MMHGQQNIKFITHLKIRGLKLILPFTRICLPIVQLSAYLLFALRPASWPSGQIFQLLIMRSRVRFPVLPWGFFFEGEDPLGDHGLANLVELRFKAPPGTSYSYITIHLIGTT